MVDNLSYLSGGTVSIDQPEQQAPVSIDSKNPFVQLPFNEETGKAMAARAALGVSRKTTLDEDTIHDAIVKGRLLQVQEQAASQIDAQRMNNALGKVSTVTDPKTIQEMFKIQDPDTVFQRHYAQEYVDHLDWVKDEAKTAQDTPLYADATGLPQEYDYVKQYGSAISGIKEYIRDLKNFSPPPTGIDQTANLIADFATLGLYGETRMRQAGVFSQGLLLGTNIENQMWRIYSLAATDFDKAKEEVYNTYQYIYKTDPVMANRWAAAMEGQGEGERFMNDLFTVLNVGGVIGAGVRPAKVVKNAVGDMVRAPAESIPPRVSAPAAAGDLSTSAVQKVLRDEVNKFKGTHDPNQEMKERLPSIYDTDKTAAASDPGRLGREKANRIADQTDASRDAFIDAVMTANRVNKVPAPVAMESRLRQIEAGIADQNRGIDNSVLNVQHHSYSEASNTHYFEVKIGTPDGDVFRSVDELRSNARLNGWIEKGSLIETPKNLRRQTKLESLLKAYDSLLTGGKELDEFEPGKAIWRSADTDYPIEVLDEAPQFDKKTKRYYQAVKHGEHSKSYVPFDEIIGTRKRTAGVSTAEGKAKLEAGIQLIRDKIASLPRHETGFVIGKAPLKETNPDVEAIHEWENEGGAVVERQGAGFYISKLVPLRPDQSFVRDGLITTMFNTVKEFRTALKSGEVSTSIPLFNNWRTGWINAIMGRARNPSERLSIAENLNRLVATHGPSVLLGLGEKTLKPLKTVPRRDWEPLNRMLRANQKAFNEETKGPGIWFDTPSQVQDWFQTYAGRLPHDNTVEAYFAYKNLGIHDLNLRDLIVGQRKMEYGIQLNNIKYRDISGNEAETGFFEGARLYDLPADNKFLMITGTNKESTKVMRSRFLKNRGQIEADIKEGKAKLIRVADPKKRPLADLSPRRVEYVLTYGDRHQEKSISPVGHINRMGGGHLIPEWGWYAKQAHVDEGVYEGDKTILNFLTRAQAQEAIPAMERVREAFKKYKASAEGRLSEADRRDIERFEGEGGAVGTPFLDAAVEANKATGIPFWKHYDWYFGKNKMLDLNEPIHVVPQDTKILDMPVEGEALKARHKRIEVDEFGNQHTIHLIDGTRGDGSLLGKAMVPFTQERDAEGIWTLKNKGTQQNPMFSYEPAPYLDPITAMERSYSRIARSYYMSDMQDFSREHWLHQAAPFLKTETTDSLGDIRENPLYYFHHPVYKDGTPTELRWQLEANRKQAIEFSGIPSDVQKGIRAIGQALADSIYKKFGADNRFTMWAISELPKRRDPIGFVRNMVFNPVLGMFSLPSMFTQISTFGNVLAISPKYAPKAAMMSLLYGWSKLNRTPEIMNHLDGLATTFGLRSGDFKEFVNLMERTGFHNTGNEHAFASNSLGDKVIKNGAMTLLDWGRLPFNIGSGFTKIGGFATAYLEHRAANQFGSIGQQELSTILGRAALLDHNMSSAFATKLHTGAFSVPMQFQAYDLRLAEMMTGKNLTPAEKARLFTMSAMMYGAVGGGLTVVGFPIANYLTKKAETAGGYVPGDNPLADLVMAGVPATIGKYITGMGDYSKGTLYNVSKWGNKGIDPFEQILAEDKPMRDIIGGVAGNIFYNTLQNSYGLRSWIRSKAIGDNGERPLTLDDIIDNFNEISTVRNTKRLFYAVNNGKWITKNEGRITDISRTQALVQFVTGLSPEPGTDVWIKQRAVQEATAEIRWHQNYISKIMQRALVANQNNDPDSFRKYMRQVEAELETYIPLEMQHQTITKAYDQFSQDQKDRINYELYFKQRKDMETYQRTLK